MKIVSDAALLIFLLVLSIQDIRRKSFSLWLLAAFGVPAALYPVLQREESVFLYAGGAAVGLLLLLLSYLTGEKIGRGDAIMFGITGGFLGFYGNVALLYFSCVFSGVFALFLTVSGKKGMSERIPFAPFSLLAFIVMKIVG